MTTEERVQQYIKETKRTKRTEEAKNLKMNSETYKLRREVMNYIYEAKKLTDLPRIEIRITEKTDEFAGLALIGHNIIWINEMIITKPGYRPLLKQIVFHEIIHAVFGVNHIEDCPLMNSKPIHKALNDTELKKHFLKYVS